MPGFHNRYTGMPGLNSYSMPGLANCDTGHKALCPVSIRAHRLKRTKLELCDDVVRNAMIGVY